MPARPRPSPVTRLPSPYASVTDYAYASLNEDGIEIRLPFPVQEYDKRLSRVHDLMEHKGLDALVLTSPDSIFYLTAYQTPGNPFCALVIPRRSSSAMKLITRELECTNAKFRTSVTYQAVKEGQQGELLTASYLKLVLQSDSKINKRIGFEASSPRLTVHSQKLLEAEYPADWSDETELVMSLRSIKSHYELTFARKAAEIVIEGYKAGIAALQPGATETLIAGEMNRAMMARGAEYSAYPAFVSSGLTGCLGHHAASRNVVQQGDVAFLEVGACFNRYHAAKMHTVYVGHEPPSWYVVAEQMLKRAIIAGRNACVDGAVAREVDAAMRRELGDFGKRHWMSERSGYSIGTGLATDWSEKILLIDPRSDAVVKAGMTIHLIPWCIIEGVGAMGFSDTVLVESDGAPASSLFAFEPPRYYERTIRTFIPVTRPPLDHSQQHIASLPARVAAAQAFHRSQTAATPLLTVNWTTDVIVHIKDESRRCGVRAFKSLGVGFAIDELFRTGALSKGDTVASMTDGNHGEALAVVSRQRGLSCVIFLPHNVCADRLAVLRALGADCRMLHGGSYDDCIARLRAEAKREGWVIVADSSWEGYTSVPLDIVAGYTHLFDEAMQELNEPPTHVLVQAGVGGLLAAACAYFRAVAPDVRVVSVEPVDAGCILENAKAERAAHELRECEGAADSNMQGLNCGTPSLVSWPLITSYISSYLAIGDEWAREAVRTLYHTHRLSVSESGAAGFAGLLAALSGEGGDDFGLSGGGSSSASPSRVLVVLTEGVTNASSFNEIIGSRAVTETPAEVAAAIAERCGIALDAIDMGATSHQAATCETTTRKVTTREVAACEAACEGPMADPCPVCLGPFISPVTLGCSHMLCLECMTSCAEGGHCRCPVCRTPHLLDVSLLSERSKAYRRSYASWRTGEHKGVAGEVDSITKPDRQRTGTSGGRLIQHVSSAGLLFGLDGQMLGPPPSAPPSSPKQEKAAFQHTVVYSRPSAKKQPLAMT